MFAMLNDNDSVEVGQPPTGPGAGRAGDEHDARSTSVVGTRSITAARVPGLAPESSLLIRSRAAIAPIASASWLTTVIGGVVAVPQSSWSTPISDRSSGIRRRSSWAARNAPRLMLPSDAMRGGRMVASEEPADGPLRRLGVVVDDPAEGGIDLDAGRHHGVLVAGEPFDGGSLVQSVRHVRDPLVTQAKEIGRGFADAFPVRRQDGVHIEPFDQSVDEDHGGRLDDLAKESVLADGRGHDEAVDHPRGKCAHEIVFAVGAFIAASQQHEVVPAHGRVLDRVRHRGEERDADVRDDDPITSVRPVARLCAVALGR